jgi:hypothetical protein
MDERIKVLMDKSTQLMRANAEVLSRIAWKTLRGKHSEVVFLNLECQLMKVPTM